jgi:hypothetical protein
MIRNDYPQVQDNMKITPDQQNELMTKIITQKEIKEDYV